MSPSGSQRLLRDLHAVGVLVEHDGPSAGERLAAAVGPDGLAAVQRPCLLERAAAHFARLTQWQWSVLLMALACGLAVSLMGVIELIWQFRSVLAGFGAVTLVLSVFWKTRQHRFDETWIGS
jgi:hypothetical protein